MGLAAGLSWGLAKSESAAEQVRADRKLTAAIIGHTGKGNYGHSLELIFNDRENIQVVAVADPNPTGRAKAAAQCKALRQYANYREMLEKEKPSLVCIAPAGPINTTRWDWPPCRVAPMFAWKNRSLKRWPKQMTC